jgi:hypothetical protein
MDRINEISLHFANHEKSSESINNRGRSTRLPGFSKQGNEWDVPDFLDTMQGNLGFGSLP